MTTHPRPWPDFPVPWDLGHPSSMFNAMIAPMTAFPIRGVLWYQGESNIEDAEMYRQLLAGLIFNWRRHWNRPDLPFGIVQLAGFGPKNEAPSESRLAEFRQVQFDVAMNIPGCGIVSALDLGDPEDIHPKNKKPVGQRLADWALGEVYGSDHEWCGPVVDKVIREDTALRVFFTHAGEGLRARHEPLRSFEVQDDLGVWHRRTAVIDSADSLLVETGSISCPRKLRYAWSDTPDCDLENSHGLPAFPFLVHTLP